MSEVSTRDGWETIYGEMYEELRRYRNVEFEVSRWNTTIMLVGIGAISGAQSSTNINFGDTGRIALAVGVISATLLNVYFMLYCRWRYQQVRKVLNRLEPEWAKDEATIKTAHLWLAPTSVNVLIQFILGALLVIVVVSVSG